MDTLHIPTHCRHDFSLPPDDLEPFAKREIFTTYSTEHLIYIVRCTMICIIKGITYAELTRGTSCTSRDMELSFWPGLS